MAHSVRMMSHLVRAGTIIINIVDDEGGFTCMYSAKTHLPCMATGNTNRHDYMYIPYSVSCSSE